MISYESQYYGVVPFLSEYLMHYQVKGAKHGVRRWQNPDGSLTPAGYIHYGVGQGRNKAATDKKTSHDSKFKNDSALRHKTIKRIDDMVHQGADIAEAIDEVSRKTGVSYDALDAEYRKSGKYHSDPKTGEMEPKPGSGALPQKVMPGDDYYVRKGTTGQRFTTEKNEEVGDERKYLTYTDKDKQIYRDFYP